MPERDPPRTETETAESPGDAPADATRTMEDRELELYRTLLETPTEFRSGFTWTTVAGALFCGLLMIPGSIYLSLIAGSTISAAWVTLIIFSEISRRAMKAMNTQELVVLLYVAGAMAAAGPVAGMVAGGPMAELVFRQFLVGSDAVRDAGLVGSFPAWYVPDPSSDAIASRNLLDPAWLVPLVLVVATVFLGAIQRYTLGYFFFRLTSDVEKMPFPFAAVGALGSMALAESGEKKTTDKWRLFSIGAVIGLAFAFVQIGIPLITGSVLAEPITIIPLPWWETSRITEGFLPAMPTGLAIDLGLVLVGMIMPFWAIVGQMAAVALSLVLNPILYHMGVLTRWQPGMDTVATSFVNSIDFWMSFGLGAAAALAVVSIVQTVAAFRKSLRQSRERRAALGGRRDTIWAAPPGRGDFSPWLALGLYMVCAVILVWICHALVPRFPVVFFVALICLYQPFIAYINARLTAIAGQSVSIPFIREGAILLSGYKGVDIWLAPMPNQDYGSQAQHFRTTELTGTNLWSYAKAEILVVPLSLLLSFLFWSFIWHANAIPSANFPFAQKMWDLQAKNAMLAWSMTLDTEGATPLFFQALHPRVITGGFLFTLAAFGVLSSLGLPIMAVYGFLQAVGGIPHLFIPQIIGGLVGKFYLQRKYGQRRFLQSVPVLAAGYGTGVGLVALFAVAVNLVGKAISMAPF
jgi:hypothetical protein